MISPTVHTCGDPKVGLSRYIFPHDQESTNFQTFLLKIAVNESALCGPMRPTGIWNGGVVRCSPSFQSVVKHVYMAWNPQLHGSCMNSVGFHPLLSTAAGCPPAFPETQKLSRSPPRQECGGCRSLPPASLTFFASVCASYFLPQTGNHSTLFRVVSSGQAGVDLSRVGLRCFREKDGRHPRGRGRLRWRVNRR